MKIGALWLKKTKDGKTYMSGVMGFPGFKQNFAVFRNEEKQNDNQPDYNIIWSPPQADNGNSNGNGYSSAGSNNFNDGIPF